MEYATYVGAPALFELTHACASIRDAFGGGVYLVGSSLERRDFRDVDVRCILDDTRYVKLFGANPKAVCPLWTLLCASLSTWLREKTGLPVDFQFQHETEAAEYKGRRHPLGLFTESPLSPRKKP